MNDFGPKTADDWLLYLRLCSSPHELTFWEEVALYHLAKPHFAWTRVVRRWEAKHR